MSRLYTPDEKVTSASSRYDTSEEPHGGAIFFSSVAESEQTRPKFWGEQSAAATMSEYPHILLRAEQKPLEHRSFSPAVIRSLVQAGYPVSVERSSTDPNFRRIFNDDEYEAAGAKLVASGGWPNAEPGTIVLGLKEIPEEDFALKNEHITFAHCYKQQGGWQQVLSRFPRGGSVLYDLEFLVDEHGRRVSAFGFHAGFTGAALGIKTLAWQLSNPGQKLPSVGTFTDGRGYYLNEDELSLGRKPTAMVLGALGRCGRGAVDLFVKAGIPEKNITSTLEIYLSEPIPPFVDNDLLSQPGRNLGVVVDVSCDTTNPHNPLPIYSINTTFEDPTVPVEIKNDQNTNAPLSVISIDHLPSMLPREASESFSEGLKESLLQLKDRKTARVWVDAEKLFNEKVALLPEELRTKEA
ncbi:LOW QUALITY PROTEIN: Saccharopine dehydrogenase [NAD(+), L-lysine-forming] [Paramyrothecium foliicola]|nr:LOW QUALITY PROTEIN: Saccharopine dehydrogenase [NAD(+), L-lysine-forming] [Paramyrothecium foliicola]